MSGAGTKQMPRYQCHKKVWALKIKTVEIQMPGGDYLITPEDNGYEPFLVTFFWTNKFNPQVGGYYVVYEDGYSSFSPAKAFEDGYTRIAG